MNLIKQVTRLLLWCAAFAGCAAAFGAEVTITVIDEDLALPLEGAVVTVWDGTERLCDAEGKVTLDAPDDRPVVVRIRYPGYEGRRVALQPGMGAYTASLRLGGTMEAQELVVEAARPGSSETVSGQSVAISGRELARQSETGIVEDVMAAVKLLSGVGYAGDYATLPSIRGGEPDDITAAFDGFYVDRPFHWGGAFSIFDPKMVESAQLSHGVFSSRYGHTISGLLDIHAKNPATAMTEASLSLSTSAANLTVSLPLGASGGLALMGRITYWDPFVKLAKYFFKEVRFVSTAPYIRSMALGLSYNLSADLSLAVNGFFGIDGIAARYEETNFDWNNKIGFLTTALNYSPRRNILFRARLGAGFAQNEMKGIVLNELNEMDSGEFFRDSSANVQARFDFDWELGGGFVVAAGLEERYSHWAESRRGDVENNGLSSALYALVEYHSADRRFGVEAGIRGDHFALVGEGFTFKGIPAANPRLNLTLNALENRGIINALTLTAGTGLFSSVNSVLQDIRLQDVRRGGLGPLTATQNRAWTSVIGAKVDFDGYALMLEGYVKRVFRRAYTTITGSGNDRHSDYFFDGAAFIWGFDAMLQKFSSRYWDGWISYSYINARYRDPRSTNREHNHGDWYYPNFHRFHTFNIIINYTPVEKVQLMMRLGIASGVPIPRVVSVWKSPSRWEWELAYDDYSRTGVNVPLDIKLSLFGYHKNGKVLRELYLNVENLLSPFYKPKGWPDFNHETGEVSHYHTMATYELPVPMMTFGIKWSF